jgi:MarC family membrane protein
MHSTLSSAILLFRVMDPFGNIPLFLTTLDRVPEPRWRKVLVRELLIVLGVFIVFWLAGPLFLKVLQVSASSLRIAGGIVRFLIALQMVFGKADGGMGGDPGVEPLVVPLAVPSIAGPSALATILLMVGQQPVRRFDWLLTLLLAWLRTALVLLPCARVGKLLGRRGVDAMGRLMGLILTTRVVEMFLQGLRDVWL